MPPNRPAPLPEPLRYLQSFVNVLAKLPPEEWNEDVDASRLESALRKRLRGLDEVAATEELSKDREMLLTWLETTASPGHPAHWILGYLSLPELADYLTRPAERAPRGPKISFDAPKGWRAKSVPFSLNLKKGKLVGVITAIDHFSFDLGQRQAEYWVAPPDIDLTRETQSVSYGEISGKKYTYRQVVPAPWKQVDYLLSVPGGFARVTLCAMGDDFDETPFELNLHTLRLSASP